jgi:hypothetical protein
MIYRGRRTNRRIIAGGVAALALALSPLAAQAAQVPASAGGYAPSSVSAVPSPPLKGGVHTDVNGILYVVPKKGPHPDANGVVFHLPKPTVDPNANGIVFHVPDSKGATTANGV